MLIPTSENTKTVTDLRENTLSVLKAADKQGHLYIFHRSDPKAVVMSMDAFSRLQEMAEDYSDERDAQKLSKQARGKGISMNAMVTKYSE